MQDKRKTGEYAVCCYCNSFGPVYKYGGKSEPICIDCAEDTQEEILPVIPGNKTSRNAPCPCGSGKKYKRCCLNKS